MNQYYVQLSNGTIVRSNVPISFDVNGWSKNIDVEIRLQTNESNILYGFHNVENFSFRRDFAVAYWGQ